jgi:Cu+-exporting ATPase
VVGNANRLRRFTPPPLRATAPVPAAHEVTVETGAEPVAVTDPVCGMRVDPASAAASLDHGGTTYWFCSTGCRDTFAADHGTPAAHHGA